MITRQFSTEAFHLFRGWHALVQEAQAGKVHTVHDVAAVMAYQCTDPEALLRLLWELVPPQAVQTPPPKPLTPSEARVYRALQSTGGRPVGADTIQAVLGYACPNADTTLVRAHVANLRRKGVPIASVRGYGYRLVTEAVGA